MTTTASAKVAFEFGKCSVVVADGQPCGRQVVIMAMSGRCAYHEALAAARNLTPDELDDLRDEMAAVVPWTPEEKRERRIAGYLSSVHHAAKSLRDSEARARDAGATEEQIAEAQFPS